MRALLALILSLSLCLAFADFPDSSSSGVQDIQALQKNKQKEDAVRIGGQPIKYPTLTDNSYSVVDDAKTLNKKETLSLNNHLFELYQAKQVNLKLATIESLDAMHAKSTSFEKYGKVTYSQWNIMATGPDLRILVLFDKSLKKVSIFGPSDWNKANAENVRKLIAEYFMPAINKGQFAKGINEGMDATITYIRTGSLPSFFGFFFKLILFILIIGGAVYYARQNPDNEVVKKVVDLLAPLKGPAMALKDKALNKLKR